MIDLSNLPPQWNPRGLSLAQIQSILARTTPGVREVEKVYLLDRNYDPILVPDPARPGQQTCLLSTDPVTGSGQGAVASVQIAQNGAQDIAGQCTITLKEIPGLAIHALTDKLGITYCFVDDAGLLLELPQGIF